MDRISQLPQPIQHNILSFLEQNDVVRVSVLSKTWGAIVRSRSSLHFNEFDFKSHDTDRFMSYVDESVQEVAGRNLSVQRFSLRTENYAPRFWEDHLNRWIRQLTGSKVDHISLVLKAHVLIKSYYYIVPSAVFLSETLTRLRLRHCSLAQCDGVRLPNLRQLSLADVSLRQDTIERFMSGCPNLAILKLSFYDTISSVSVSGSDKLEIVHLTLSSKVTDVKVVAPSLRVFKVAHNYVLDNCTAKIELSGCESSLRRLRLSGVDVTGGVGSLVSKFRGLEDLKLLSLRVESMEITCPKLRKLQVFYCSKMERVKISTPDLIFLEYFDNKLPFYSVDSSFFLNFEQFYSHITIGEEFQSMLDSFNELFVELDGFKNIKLIVTFDKNAIVCEEYDENFINMLSILKDTYPVDVEVMRMPNYECMVEHVFCSNPETMSIVSKKIQDEKKLLKVLSMTTLEENGEPNCCRYKSYQPKEKEELDYCKFEAYKCWWHFLYRTEMIYGETTENFNLFKFFDSTEYDIKMVKLEWIE